MITKNAPKKRLTKAHCSKVANLVSEDGYKKGKAIRLLVEGNLDEGEEEKGSVSER